MTVGDDEERAEAIESEEEATRLTSVAHYIMVHYAEKENLMKNRKRRYKSKAGQYTLEAGLRHFREQGDTAVTKELAQFNKYQVFKPLNAGELLEKEQKEALTSLIFLKE